MATVALTVSKVARGVHKAVWEGLSATNADGAVLTPENGNPFFPDKTIGIYGDFGSSGTIVLQGSMDNSSWVTLTDVHGSAISATADYVAAVTENPLYIRPFWSSGTGGDIDVILVLAAVGRAVH